MFVGAGATCGIWPKYQPEGVRSTLRSRQIKASLLIDYFLATIILRQTFLFEFEHFVEEARSNLETHNLKCKFKISIV